MIRLQVLFDREDRCYEFGDEVTGTVAVEATSDVDCTEVGITHGWGTHGRGVPEGLHERRILTSRGISLRAGECGRFPFCFQVPNGPVTYHGHYLNVDWFVRGHVRISSGKVFQEEQDFLLLGGEPSGSIFLGAKEIERKHLPARSTPYMPDPASTLQPMDINPTTRRIVSITKSSLSFVFYVVVSALALVAASAFSSSYSDWGFILSGILAATLLLRYGWPKTIQSIRKSRVELEEFGVEPHRVYRGNRLHCHLRLRTKSTVQLRQIQITLFAQERVLRPVGTTSAMDYRTVDERTFVRRFDEELPADKHFSFNYAVPVEADTPPTFSSKNNGLDWYVKVQVGLKGWPDVMETLKLTVLP